MCDLPSLLRELASLVDQALLLPPQSLQYHLRIVESISSFFRSFVGLLHRYLMLPVSGPKVRGGALGEDLLSLNIGQDPWERPRQGLEDLSRSMTHSISDCTVVSALSERIGMISFSLALFTLQFGCRKPEHSDMLNTARFVVNYESQLWGIFPLDPESLSLPK